LAPGDLPDRPAAADPAEWVRRARAGDGQAFAVLVERHERMVLRTALRLLGRMDLAQDAAQDAFLRLHRHIGRFDESRELGPWLYRVVVNVCRDVARRGHGARLVPLTDAAALASPSDGARERDEAVALEEQRRLVQAALLTLPAREREAIVLRDIEGLSSEEVARILGTSAGTVRSQVSAARLKVKRYVEAREGTRR
jgi:RNA polymerase sigma-70 factor (ECF subfamily)